jgi:hypothetical protein
MGLLSDELGETITFRTATERDLIRALVSAGVAPGQAELLVTREWAILAGENERTTSMVQEPSCTRTVTCFADHTGVYYAWSGQMMPWRGGSASRTVACRG